MSKLMKLVQAVDAASRRVHTFALLALSLVLLAPSAWAEKIPLSVFGTTVADKFYDGTTDAKTLVTAGTLEGDVQPGDDVKLSVIDAQFDNKNAGGDKEVSIRYELNGKDAEKYELAENPVTMTASIMEKVLTVAPTYKDYDGSTAITLNADGVVEGDDVTLEGTLASPEAGTQNVTGLNLSGTDAGNYQLTQSSATAYVRVNLADGQSYTLLPGTYSNSVKCVKGGAAYVSTGATLTGTNVTFAGNSAGEEGGAIYNNGKIAFDGAIDFSDNVSVSDGGAISTGGEATFAGAATFERNSGLFGGAIVNSGVLTFAASATFTDNKATGDSNAGGAIENFGGIITFNDVAVFSGNSADSGGAIYNENNDDPVTIGVINFAGLVDLQTAGDTWYNKEKTIVNWDLTGGLEQYGCISHFERYANEKANVKQLISVTDDQPVGDYVIASGDFTDVKGKDTFTITNVTSGATATMKIGGDIVNVGGVWRELKTVEAGTTTNLVFGLPPMAKLSNVEIIDAATGATNATAVVTVKGVAVKPDAEGNYLVLKGQSITVVYTATDDYMFDSFGAKTKTVTVGPLTENYAMTDDDKPATEAAWVDVREIAIDTRTRIVVASPEEVLPIAYHTNNWGEVTADQTKVYYFRDGEYGQTVVDTTNENGYVEWQPTDEEYGKYTFYQSWYSSSEYLTKTNATIYYGADYQFVYDEDAFIFVKRNADDEYGMSNLEDVTSYSLLHLTAQPEYTNVDRYELAGWKVYSYAERNTGWKTAVEAPELLKNFGDPTAVETTFEMPFTNVFVSCSYQWKSNYTETVEVGPGVYDAWEIHEGETYKAGITTTNGSIVSLRGTVNPGTVTLNPGATNVWDFTKGGRPYFTDFDSGFKLDSQATLLIRFDETLTNGTYKIADYAFSAEKETFEITNGVEAEDCTVVGQDDLKTAAWTYVGAKRFKLGCDSFGYLRLVVEWGIRQSVVIASDFSANPPFENAETNEFGEVVSFDWNGRTWTVGKDAFTSFTDLFTNEMYAVGATNLHVFGAQTIASEPPMGNTWNLDLVAYEDAEGNEAAAIVTVGTTGITPNTELVNITNELGAITGKGVIVLGKTSDKVDPSIYDEFIEGDIDVVNTGVEPKKGLAGNVRFEVNDKAKTETDEETGMTAVVLPGVENPDGGYTVIVETNAPNDVVVAGTVKVAGDVTIANKSTNELTIASTVEAKSLVINNTGRSEDAEGSITASEMEIENDVMIMNKAHLEADITAGGKITIWNGSITTLVGSYEGSEIELEGDTSGALSNVTFVSDGAVVIRGINVLTGPLTITTENDYIYPESGSGLICSIRGGNTTATWLAGFDKTFELNGKFGVVFDLFDQPTGQYTLAKNASLAKVMGKDHKGLELQMWFDDGETMLMVPNFTVKLGAGYVPYGRRLYKLDLNEDNDLVLTVADVRTHFENVKASVPAGGSVTVKVWGGSETEAVQATVSYVRNTGAYSSAYVGGEKVSFPLTLNWEKGEMGFKEILFRTSETGATDDKFFTLQLSAPVGEDVLSEFDACTVRIENSYRATKNYVRALAYPANAGSVSGAGTLSNMKSYRTLSATAKKYATFAGWYKAKADDPNVIDLTAPVEPYSSRYPKQIRVGYGTENDAGTYFAYFTNVLAVAAVVEPQAFDTKKIKQKLLPGVAGVTAQDAGTYSTIVGVKFALPVAIDDASGKGKLTISKLPSGLSLKQDRTTKAYRIEGVPTKAGVYEAKFVASNDAGKHTVTYGFVVEEIPSNAVGTFYGLILDDKVRSGIGSVTFTSGKTGSLSAKVLRRQAGTRSFSVKGYDYIDEDTFGVAMTNSYGEVLEAKLALESKKGFALLTGKAFGGEGKKWTLAYYGETNGVFGAARNDFADKNADKQQTLAAYLGTYKESISATNGIDEVGTVSYRVGSQGSIYTVAQLYKTYDGAKAVQKRTFTGTVYGFLEVDMEVGCWTALRNGSYLWSSYSGFNQATRGVQGQARYIRPNAEDKTEVVDVDQFVGAGIPE